MANFRFYRPSIVLVLLVCFILLWHKPILRVYFLLDYRTEITKLSREYNVDPAMVSAMIFVESRFNTKAESHKGARGLMQIMPSTGSWVAQQLHWQGYSDETLFEPAKNLTVGIWYLAYLKRYFGYHDYLALASYNAGFRYVDTWSREGIWNGDLARVEQIPFPETKKYLLRIVFLKKIYRYLYPELS